MGALPGGVILFSDILTPLPAIGIPFEIDDYKGPILESPIRDAESLKMMHSLDLDMLPFVGEALRTLRNEVGACAHITILRAIALGEVATLSAIVATYPEW